MVATATRQRVPTRTSIQAVPWPSHELGPYTTTHHVVNHVCLEQMNIRPVSDLLKMSHDGKFKTVAEARIKTSPPLRFANGTVPEWLLQRRHKIPNAWKPFRLYFLGSTFQSNAKGQSEIQWVRCLFWNNKKDEDGWYLQFVRLYEVFSLIHSKDDGMHKLATLN